MPVGPGSGNATAPGRDPVLVGGRYRMRNRLGSGGTADVFAAIDTVLGREVAVKVFRPVTGMGTGMGTADRICGEALTLARLRHPALVTVYDAGRHGDSAYMVTELVRGTTLRDRLAAGSLTTAQTIRLGTVLTSALDHVHGCDIIHRDIKPSNILLDELGAPRLADFGLSRTIDERTRSEPGTLVGSLAYMAPEQLLGGGASKASDVFALGLVLLEALTGDTSRRTTPLEAGIAHLLQAPRIPEGIPDSLARLLSLITAQDPQDRPDTARMLRLLEEAAASASAPASHPMVRASASSTTTATHRAPSRRVATPAAASANTAAASAEPADASTAEAPTVENGKQARRAWIRPVTVAAAGALTLALTGTVLYDVSPPPAAGAGNPPHPSPSTPARTTAPQADPTKTPSRTTPSSAPATTRHPAPEPDRARSATGTPAQSASDKAASSRPMPPRGRPAKKPKEQKLKAAKKKPGAAKGSKKK
ncbi:protein kinase [Streptomyces sp. NPDC046939]|uniref:serine/threonine-protein kinase n=1 Tax=Streptomyces sp. NPDC046939 TaxID=3155376 RepID=UPI0033FE7AC5